MEGRRNPFLPQPKAAEAVPSQPSFGQQAAGSLSFGQYMASKIQKLRTQNDGIKKSSRIFDGVAIYVNGHTEPRKEKLRTLILEHGGQFEAYQTSRVTHMIAEQLADSKLREIMSMKKPLPVVHPKWIVDSIASGKRRSLHTYIYSRCHDPLQPTFGISANPTPRLMDNIIACEVQPSTATKLTPSMHPPSLEPAPPSAQRRPVEAPRTPQECPRSQTTILPTTAIANGAFHALSNDNERSRVCPTFPPPLHLTSSYRSKNLPPTSPPPPTTRPAAVQPPPTTSAAKLNMFQHPQPAKKPSVPLFNAAPVSFGEYMTSKIAKLRDQAVSHVKRTSRVLDGVVVYVNGHTHPSKMALRLLVLQHGGAFESYLTNQVTHVVATHLSTSKALEMTSSRKKKPLPVVHPQWIVDCVAQQHRLPVHLYIYSHMHPKYSPSSSGARSSHPITPSPLPPPVVGSMYDSNLEHMDIPGQASCDDVNLAQRSPAQQDVSPPRTSSNGAQLTQCMDDQSSPVGSINLFPYSQTQPLSSPASTITLSQGSVDDSVDIPATQQLSYSQDNEDSPGRGRDNTSNHVTSPSTPSHPHHDAANDADDGWPHAIDEQELEITTSQHAHDSSLDSPPPSQTQVLSPLIETRQQDSIDTIEKDQSSCNHHHLIAHNQSRDVAGTVDAATAATGMPPKVTPPATFRPIKSTKDGAAAFVRSFFANSRLHHIGSWKSFYMQHVAEFTSTTDMSTLSFGSCDKVDRVILHVDMDCFFVSVAIRHMPSVYQTLPVAVAHSGYSSHGALGCDEVELPPNPPGPHTRMRQGTSEISSCNYIARSFGLKAGMFMETAKALCPNLIVLPYNFAEIEAVSCQIYKLFHQFTPAVQAVSCDEAFLEFPIGTDGMQVARDIRRTVFDATKCHASVGVSYNILLARLATKQAKPNNVFEISSETASDHIHGLSVRDLPGVGHVLHSKLTELNIHTCDDVLKWSDADLGRHFGAKTSVMLRQFARGKDTRPLELAPHVKSISADVNYGVRLADGPAAIEFVRALGAEVHSRLVKAGFATAALTLKLKIRHPDAPVEPAKYMGHGRTDDCSKSTRLPAPTNDVQVIEATCVTLLNQLKIVPHDLRGAGVQASRLTRVVQNQSNGTNKMDNIHQYFTAAASQDIHTSVADVSGATGTATTGCPLQSGALPPRPSRRRLRPVEEATIVTNDRASKVQKRQTTEGTHHRPMWSVPTLSQIDPDVLNTLPEALRREILHQVAPPTVPTSYSQIDQSVLNALPKPLRDEIQHHFPKTMHLRQCAAYSKAKPPPTKPAASGRCGRMSQVDAGVWAALPPSIQRELLSEVPVDTSLGLSERSAAPPPSCLTMDTAVPVLKAKIQQFGLADVGALLRRLKRQHGKADPRRFNAVLASINAHVRQLYGHDLSPAVVGPFACLDVD